MTAVVTLTAALAVFGTGAVLAMRNDAEPSHGAVSRPPALGAPALAMRGTDLSGRPVAVSRFAGKPLVIGFFGSWCGPCRRDAPVFAALARRFGRSVWLLSVAVSDDPSADRAFASRYGWTWPIVEDEGFRWSVAFGVPGVPTTYVLGPDGRLADRIVGPVTPDGLEQDLRPLVAETTGAGPPDPRELSGHHSPRARLDSASSRSW
jgi:cytochrome c biogenesis protein CcmG, thiol:disulfide interchange protein DsbE